MFFSFPYLNVIAILSFDNIWNTLISESGSLNSWISLGMCAHCLQGILGLALDRLPDLMLYFGVCVCVFFLFHSIEIKTGAKEALREKKQSSSKQATFSKAPFFWERSYFFPQQVPFALFSSAKRQTLSTSFIFTFFLLLPQKNTVYTVNGIIHELSLKLKLSLFFCS